ncbi:unnamed protein product, partial [Ectocarpus sp. 12 AP-2014]
PPPLAVDGARRYRRVVAYRVRGQAGDSHLPEQLDRPVGLLAAAARRDRRVVRDPRRVEPVLPLGLLHHLQRQLPLPLGGARRHDRVDRLDVGVASRGAGGPGAGPAIAAPVAAPATLGATIHAVQTEPRRSLPYAALPPPAPRGAATPSY